MADRSFSSGKPNPQPPRPATGQPASQAAKSQFYINPTYRPPPPSKDHRNPRGLLRVCCCSFFLLLLILVLLAAIAGGIVYAIYRPHRPSFSVSSLRLSSLNLSSSDRLTSRLDLSVTGRNPNRKVVFLYDPISVSVTSNSVGIGNGSFPPFYHAAKNTTTLRATVSSSGQIVDPSVATDLKKSSIPLEIDMETKAGVKIGQLKTKKLGMKVSCDGIEVAIPKGKKTPPALSSEISCKVKLRMKIWKWTI
ncbi:hypothetical protein HPP92_023666 [Vanilla planifolia]|uniref:Late embryogenesis abundant protein LEA-2 subgroup domain-containing protein n=1 Tax=Vanilla planifolia TaxID=51239 RepID=A0A835PNB6_VANPL|nr:hypothetical protein HPP92_024008 [Vanilla planifolia]KAG0455878.1 hypothetical protein HPP92_023666 [Vanilla planifolia]